MSTLFRDSNDMEAPVNENFVVIRDDVNEEPTGTSTFLRKASNFYDRNYYNRNNCESQKFYERSRLCLIIVLALTIAHI